MITQHGQYKMNKPGSNSSKAYLSRLKTRDIYDSAISELVTATGSHRYENEKTSQGS